MKLSAGRVAAGGAVSAAALLLVLGGVLARGQEPSAGAGEQPGGAFRLAVVDLDAVLNQSEQWADCQEEAQRLQDRMRRSLEKYDRQVRILSSDYESMPPGTSAAAEKRGRLEATLRQYQEAKEKFERELGEQQFEALSRLFNEISAIISAYAAQNDIDLVLKKQNLNVSPDQPAELGVIVTTAHVLYARERYDITDAIVRELNAGYPGEILER